MFKTIRVNMSELTTAEEPLKEEYMLIGGRGLVARILTDEVEPTCEPLGPENKLIFCTSIFAGMGVSTGNRLSVGCKSPLTGGIKESSSGGTVGSYMADHGIKVIIIEDQPDQEGPWVVHVNSAGRVSLDEASDLSGTYNYSLNEKLFARYGSDIAVASIGPAGERLYRNSTIQVTEYGTNHPSRAAARGGIGSVMGSKKIKAVVLEKAGERFKPPLVDAFKFKKVRTEFNKILAEGSANDELRKMGTPAGVKHHAETGSLPVRNFSGKQLENLNDLYPDKFAALLKKRGRSGLPCQAGCVIRCANLLFDEKGDLVVSGLEYETVALIGANCDITSFDEIAKIAHQCDDFGIDTIETGATIAVCMEAGKIPWGDAKAAMELVREMVKGTEFGKLMGEGTEAVARHLGVNRIPVAKHQAFAGYDIRGAGITGVAFATSAMGADHTTAPAPGSCAEMLPEEICDASKNLQKVFAMLDNIMCGFAWVFANQHLDKLAALYAAAFGGDADPERLLNLGTETLTLEKRFNKKAGWTDEEDRLPEFFYKEKSEITGITFRVPQEMLSQALKEFE
ncbi:MAG: aldehyde ferredoxin oxidoreductase C-terminal domain-containing protein [Bacillota bacterium]|nr:aldehyde ferredoxin oxidoreductase C-terminal domain-containing protein [Bacillota bacterium]